MSLSKIVLTGTIASGKSTLCKLIEEYGYKVISADEVNKELLRPGEKNYQAIKDSGEFKLAFDGNRLDKKKLAKIIFSNRDKMKLLNRLSHKNILDEVNRQARNIEKKPVFIEIPLYYQMEEKFENDQVWLVTADYQVQINRLVKRDGIDYEYAKTKLESQEDLIDMKAKSDVVFDNSSDIKSLRNKLEKVLKDEGLL